ncbi:hypothetical protein K431DRAFT_235364 [Polychaeton citri CBS 116435]|uniref:GPI transamidase component PIG-S n=1 Tax=Polychaeton citri CBS 116435 TaxID=1314669 RepID=A0A9P4UKN0_9PEZI|nr:hypothetical protein K431DRAFT_235364 [Polychaeton citri CBS 116435]
MEDLTVSSQPIQDEGPKAARSADLGISASEAPAESTSTLWMRRSILAAFWAVVIFFGLPQWMWATSIPRSELPLDRMDAWASGKACDLHFPISLSINGPKLEGGQLAILSHDTERILSERNPYSLYSFNVIQSVPSAINSSFPMAVLGDSTPSLQIEYEAGEAILRVRYPPSKTRMLSSFISQQIARSFEDEQAAVSYKLENSPLSRGQHARHLNDQARQSLAKRSTRSFKPASTYHLTFSMFVASATPSSWEVEEAFEQYLAPLLQPLLSTSRFTVDTQVQLYAAFSPSIAGPLLDETDSTWKLQQSDLSGFINAAEWPLSPSIGSGPTINLVLYVPSEEQTPMVIAQTKGTSWIIPQWGGVQIFNYNDKYKHSLSKDDLRGIMLTFGDQLTSLLGLPSQPASLSMRISSLTRERTTSLMLSASSTLGALSRLTLKLTSIAIPETVAKSVDETIIRLEQSCQNLRKGNFQVALEHARIAEEEAEKAFFEPSMVGQVYFPEEHKVAVYVPLLGPMSVPLLMTALKELKALRKRPKVKST